MTLFLLAAATSATVLLAPLFAQGAARALPSGVDDDQPFVDRAFRFAKANLDPVQDTKQRHFHVQLHCSQALSQRGGEEWKAYYEKVGPWKGEDGFGPVYATSIAMTVPQPPWALVPIQQR